jgi:glutamate-5-semialdehyde dehydrogenase
VSIPIGVIGVIYESRPNVTSDVASLCFKSGNPVILKGGSEAINTNKILAKLFRKALKENKVNENFIQCIDSKNRKMVDYMLSKMKDYIDVIIPRGGKNLVKRVQEFSVVPIIGHLEGLCHTFVDKEAKLKMAIDIIYNAKLRNTSICGATETILFHEKIVKKFCNPILKKLEENDCKIYGDHFLSKHYKGKISAAKEKDWSTEYLSSKVSVKTVKNCEEAIKHINKYGTMHTDSIITKNKKTAKKFLKNVKSSIAMHNTSTQFADGGEFGFGGEVGISTNTLPPRGPVGLGQLISYKYEVVSNGKIRK